MKTYLWFWARVNKQIIFPKEIINGFCDFEFTTEQLAKNKNKILVKFAQYNIIIIEKKGEKQRRKGD